MLPYYNREAIEKEVVMLIEDYLGTVSFPLDVSLVVEKLGVPMIPYPEPGSPEWYHCVNASPDAFTICSPDFEFVEIFYNPQPHPATRMAFSICHEIGHIFLGHTDPDDLGSEDEADYFAGYLLAPHPVIAAYRLESVISCCFNVGSWCADISREQIAVRRRLGGPTKDYEWRLLEMATVTKPDGTTIGPRI